MNSKKLGMMIGGATVLMLMVAGVAIAHAGRGAAGAGVGLSYDGDVSSGVLTNVNKNGTVLFEKVEYAAADAKLHVRGPGVGVRALNATTVTLTLPADATIAIHEAVQDWSPAGATITYATGETANLRVHNGTIGVEGSVITLTLEADGGAHYGPAGLKGGCAEGKMMRGPRGPGGEDARAGPRDH